MKVIDELKPRFMYSLHNAGFGGVYYYVSRACEPLYQPFSEIPEWFNLTLDLGEPEVSNAVTLAPAIYQTLSIEDDYDHMEKVGIADPSTMITSGASSEGYARHYGTFSLIVELPYYDEPRVNDLSASETTRRDAIIKGLDEADVFAHWMTSRLEKVQPYLTLKTAVRSATENFLRLSVGWRDTERKWAVSTDDTLRKATQAELFSTLLGRHFYQLLLLGMFARTLADEVAAGNSEPLVAELAAEAKAYLDQEGAAFEGKLNYRALPIRSLVGVQVCAGLATAEYLQDNPSTT